MTGIDPVRILLATDGSAHSRAAETLLAALRWPPGSAATVLAVVRQRWSLLGLGLNSAAEVHETLGRLQRVARGAAQATVGQAARRLSDAGLPTVTVVSEGEPGQMLVGLAAEAQVDLIALGAQGFSQFNAPRLGSTAWEVLHAARPSVLVARPGPRLQPARIVLAADDLIDWAVPGAWPLALLPSGAQVTVAKLALGSEASNDHEFDELRAVDFGEALQAHGLTVRIVFPTGEPRAELVRLARAQGADLVIVDGQAAGGQLATAVAKFAPCSVLVAQPAAAWPRRAAQQLAATSLGLGAAAPVY